ncbi:Thioredoxin domain-containing protein [Plasmodiophora brassicae]
MCWTVFVAVLALLMYVVGGGGAMVEPSADADVKTPADVFRGARARSSVVLDDRSFHAVVGDDAWFIKLYAPWCGHCLDLAPTWDRLAKEIDPAHQVRIGEIDCTKNPKLQAAFRVQGYPTLVFYEQGRVWHYQGQRSLDAFLAHIVANPATGWSQRVPTFIISESSGIFAPREPVVPGNADAKPVVRQDNAVGSSSQDMAGSFEIAKKALKSIQLTQDDVDQLTTQGTWLIKMCSPYAASCQEVIPLWMSLTAKLDGADGQQVRFGEMLSTPGLLAKYGRASVPVFFLVKDGRTFLFDGTVDEDSILAFVLRDWQAMAPVEPISIAAKPALLRWMSPRFRAFLIVTVLVMGFAVYARIVARNKSKQI